MDKAEKIVNKMTDQEVADKYKEMINSADTAESRFIDSLPSNNNQLETNGDSKPDDEVNEEYYDRWALDHSEYIDLFDYCIGMWGCSTERNVTAIAVGLAKLNNMSLSDLFKLSIAL